MTVKPVIGIVGGIGCGKSTVAACFAGLGCAVIDADALAHAVLDE
ncbi:MAG: dephospho-CoA kinase, partial [Planctomycetota bacterium]